MEEKLFEDISCNLCESKKCDIAHKFQHKGSNEWKLVKCCKCGFVFHSPRLKEKTTIEAYDNKNLYADVIHSKGTIDEYLSYYLAEDNLKKFNRE